MNKRDLVLKLKYAKESEDVKIMQAVQKIKSDLEREVSEEKKGLALQKIQQVIDDTVEHSQTLEKLIKYVSESDKNDF